MKTEGQTSSVTWTNNVDLLQLESEECLPVIGSCQVSTILSNLEAPNKEVPNLEIPPGMEVILLHNNYKPPTVEEHIINSTNFIIIKEPPSTEEPKTNKNNQKKTKSKNSDKDDVTFMNCPVCPYISLSETKIALHIQKEHSSTQESTKKPAINCPACANVFYNKEPLQSHLMLDHGVEDGEIETFIRVIFSSLFEEPEVPIDSALNLCSEENTVSPKKEVMVNYILNSDDKSKVDEESESDHDAMDNASDSEEDDLEVDMIKEDCEKPLNLPTVDFTHNNAEKLFNTYIKQEPVSVDDNNKVPKAIQKCLLCKARLTDVDKLNYHMKCHKDSCFKCPECSQLFAFWKPLTGHLWRIHRIDMDLYSCDKCDYKTFSLAKLNNIHKLIHSDVKAFRCEVCDKAFKNVKQVRNHRLIHRAKNVSFYCDICSKKFNEKRQLRIHMDTVHSKIKPFLCNYCGYKGGTKSALNMHVRQHTGEKPFSCDSCEYVTADHNSLRRHKLRHTGHKPYKCPHCDYACIQSSTFKVHVKTKHPSLEKDLLYSCNSCKFKTINKDNYCSHVYSKHKQDRWK